jgi:hypothetical protein
MLTIEIDGSSHDSQEAQKRDRQRQTRLESLGVRFLRLTKSGAKYHVEGVVEVIQGWVLQNGYTANPPQQRRPRHAHSHSQKPRRKHTPSLSLEGS